MKDNKTGSHGGIKPGYCEGIAWFAVSALLLTFPLYSNKLTFIMNILVYSLFAMGYNISFGHSGMMAMAQGAFVGLGGYVSAALLTYWTNSIVVFLIALVACLFVAYLLSLMLFSRLKIGASGQTRSLFLTIVTLGFMQIIYYLSISVFSKWTGGSHGLGKFLREPIRVVGNLALDFTNKTTTFYFIVLVALISILLMRWFMLSPCREILNGIRDNELRLAFLGHNVKSRKILMFVVSCFFCGLAGCLYALEYGVLDTTPFTFNFITEAMIICVIGGRKTFYGPILGSTVYLAAKYFISMYTDAWLLIIAVIIVFVVLYAPNGLGGCLQQLWRKYQIRKEAGGASNG